jgi:hypothetical protein
MKEYFSASRFYNSSWNSTDSCCKWFPSPRSLESYFSMIDIEIWALKFLIRDERIFSASRSYNSSWNFTDSCSKWCPSPRSVELYFSMIDIEILALNILDKRWKNIFQPADLTILPETPQIPALSGSRLRDRLNQFSQWLILRFLLLISLIRDERIFSASRSYNSSWNSTDSCSK